MPWVDILGLLEAKLSWTLVVEGWRQLQMRFDQGSRYWQAVRSSLHVENKEIEKGSRMTASQEAEVQIITVLIQSQDQRARDGTALQVLDKKVRVVVVRDCK